MRFSQAEICAHVASYTGELAKIAMEAGLAELAFVLGMAHIEAREQVVLNQSRVERKK